MNLGRNLIISFDQVGKHYDLVAIKNTDMVVTWLFQLFEGVDTWKNQGINGQPITVLDETWSTDFPNTPEGAQKKVQQAITEINQFLIRKFGEGIPMTWIQQLEALVARIVFFRDAAGVPQIKIQ